VCEGGERGDRGGPDSRPVLIRVESALDPAMLAHPGPWQRQHRGETLQIFPAAPDDDLGNLPLSALLAIYVKAGAFRDAHRPDYGWTDYAQMASRSWQAGKRTLEERGLIVCQGQHITLAHTVVADEFDAHGKYVCDKPFLLVPSWLQAQAKSGKPFLEPAQRRVCLGLIACAHFKTGKSVAGQATIARRCGRSRSGVSRALAVLKTRHLSDARERVYTPPVAPSTRWTVALADRAKPYGCIPCAVLARYFAFDFRSRAELQRDEVANLHPPLAPL